MIATTAATASAPKATAKGPNAATERAVIDEYCVECHNPDKMRGDLDLSTVKALVAGGKSGAAFVPGKPDESYLITLTEGKDTPKDAPK